MRFRQLLRHHSAQRWAESPSDAGIVTNIAIMGKLKGKNHAVAMFNQFYKKIVVYLQHKKLYHGVECQKISGRDSAF